MKDLPVTKGTEKGIAVKILPPQDLANRASEVHAMIARRAYELFANRGCEHGQDLQDWLAAESDIVHVCRHDLRESAEAVVLRAELPNSFKADQLPLSVEPRRLVVSGERELDTICGGAYTAHIEKRTRRILRMHELPSTVDPSKTTATLTDETLEIVMPKVAAGGKSTEKLEAASAGR
jgi:HSP20 family molecular chaperone IbpA